MRGSQMKHKVHCDVAPPRHWAMFLDLTCKMPIDASRMAMLHPAVAKIASEGRQAT